MHVFNKIVSTWKVFLATLAQITLPTVHHDTVTLKAMPRRILTRVEFLATEITLVDLWLAMNFQMVLQKETLVEHRMTFRALCLDVLLGT